MQAQQQTLSPRLEYFKCHDCLSTFTSREKITLCVCGGTVESMGKVGRPGIFFRTEEHCACDARCTNAMGPSCDCACGGENHGTGKVVEVIVETGAVVVKSLEGAEAKGAEYRKALAEAKARYEARWGEVNKARASGVWVEREAYLGSINAWKNLLKIKQMKVYKSRQAALVKYLSGSK